MRLSLCLDPGRPWSDAVALARLVEARGWYAVYQCDHFMPHDVEGRSVDGPVSECWTTLAALATVTSRVRLGSLVLGNTYRHPVVVANMAATLDRISGGRVVLGVGAGWQPNEHRALGIPLRAPAERLDAFDESCRVIRMLLDEGRASFDGATYRVDDARCDPRPLQPRLPLLVGGGGERRTMRVAARWGDVWHSWVEPSELARKNAVLDTRCAEIGRDPTTVSRATGGGLRIGRHDEDREVSGSLDQVLHGLHEYAEAGADEFIVRDHASDAVDDVAQQLELLSPGVLRAPGEPA
jgi:F420-dependent oxidoreductase-like protein